MGQDFNLILPKYEAGVVCTLFSCVASLFSSWTVCCHFIYGFHIHISPVNYICNIEQFFKLYTYILKQLIVISLLFIVILYFSIGVTVYVLVLSCIHLEFFCWSYYSLRFFLQRTSCWLFCAIVFHVACRWNWV